MELAVGLRLLDSIHMKAVLSYQPYWAVRAHLLERLVRVREAFSAFDLPIGLSEDQSVRNFLLKKRG
jgi:predicted RNA polymerase sigma factor